MKTFKLEEFLQFIYTQPEDRKVNPENDKDCFLSHFGESKGIKSDYIYLNGKFMMGHTVVAMVEELSSVYDLFPTIYRSNKMMLYTYGEWQDVLLDEYALMGSEPFC